MKKETFYFSHDYNARNDIKIKKLICKHGLLGYGLFWALIEELYNNSNVLNLDYDTLAFDLRTDLKIIESVINDFELFEIDYTNQIFSSQSVKARLNERNEKSEKAKLSALKRWGKNANALHTNNDSIAIKESKGKESKGKENKELNNNSFIHDLNDSNVLDDEEHHLDNLDALNAVKSGKKTKSESKKNLKNELDLILPFNSNEFLTVWTTLLSEKKWKSKSKAALQASLKKLASYGEQGAIQSMLDAISGNYQGVFPPKNFIQQNQPSKIQQTINAHEQAKQMLNNDTSN